MSSPTGLSGWQGNLFRQARKNAATRGIPFSLSPGEFMELVSRSEGRCMVSGIPFDHEARVDGVARRPYAPSLDRVECEKGYTADNVRLTCVAVNNALGEWGLDVLLTIARAMTSDNPLPVGAWRAPHKRARTKRLTCCQIDSIVEP